MPSVLVFAELADGAVADVTFEAIAAGTALKDAYGGPLKVAVVAARPAEHAASLGRDGVDEVLSITAPTEHLDPHVAEEALLRLVETESVGLLLMGHTADAMAIAPAVAVRAEGTLLTDAVEVAAADGLLCVRRGAFGGKLQADHRVDLAETTVITVRTGAFAAAPAGAAAPERAVDLSLGEAGGWEHVALRKPPAADVDIADAEFLVSIGRGVENEDEVERFADLARRLGAQLSVSRPLVDAGWAPASQQVGQSGRRVSPKVYLALGISGAAQHLAGIGGAETVIAVNSDPNAPIFEVADYGVNADLFEIADAIERRIG